ncbi:MAG: rhodanese-like domain-containing protein [Candidatus Marinimicrobia bacterium]|jgi:rhodanese-related sulfurtransferase|nr:rhodanese-like domain-containing protein [Candidatus Neomarinimicrobiota bacterium]MBT3617446.1 rhodanese-like domain-containing protein [Candidatus Neomarinimicrobiota bacterium]MBT3829386.1 rhodanese-like domain-containing protein [Candidatus Neomarinimicrobiota bacterium]MBT3997669.1 rhodanese-like domain-containing protein [Candidatus Neomarinimicrobiota bacterium]MBT4280967.1 rhodanese-like domain-containing protein [Candidatus Neomarinimicrobiota bacterium]
MTPRNKLTAVLLGFGLIIAFVPENTTKPFRLTASEMLNEVQYGSELIHPDELAEWLINNDPSIQLIDIRSRDEFQNFHLDGAINIPLNQLLDDEWVDFLDQDIKMNILYSNGTTRAHEAWMISRQLGYENNTVLMGGLNYWTETILNPNKPKSTSPDDEIAKYEFRKGASQYFGSGGISKTTSTKTKITKPKIKQRKKKKAPEGGC